jgi:hypothetical protein
MVDIRRGVTVVHLNVSSGYLTYLTTPGDGRPRLKTILLKEIRPRTFDGVP